MILKPALIIQLGHIILSILWNIAGLVLIGKGQAALGPTASLNVAAAMILLGFLLLLGAYKNSTLYLLVSLLLMVGALLALQGAFTKPPSLWPSDIWRYLGALLNSVGVFGALYGFSIVLFNRIRSNS